jgi:hypothetical protein
MAALDEAFMRAATTTFGDPAIIGIFLLIAIFLVAFTARLPMAAWLPLLAVSSWGISTIFPILWPIFAFFAVLSGGLIAGAILQVWTKHA